jgi:hypothetical protein
MDTDHQFEEWRPIPDCDGCYSVSSMGRVRSEPSARRTTGRQRGRVLKLYSDRKGYRKFGVCVPGKPRRSISVHRAVASAFLGAADPGEQVNHKNGDKTDNRPENLEYVTCRENIRHCWANGLHGTDHCRGEANNLAKLTGDDVRTIRRLHGELSARRLAAMFGVSVQNIAHIIRRKTWKHVA